jgi:hypothetical protein
MLLLRLREATLPRRRASEAKFSAAAKVILEREREEDTIDACQRDTASDT